MIPPDCANDEERPEKKYGVTNGAQRGATPSFDTVEMEDMWRQRMRDPDTGYDSLKDVEERESSTERRESTR